MVRHGKRQTRDDDVGQGFARHIDALPETVGSEEHGIHVRLEFLEHQRARRAGALDETFQPQLVEERLHQLAHVAHQFKVGEQHEGFAVGHFHEVFDPMNERVAIAGVARVGHFVGDEQFHLSLVIEWRADLKERGFFRADAMGKVIHARLRTPQCGL